MAKFKILIEGAVIRYGKDIGKVMRLPFDHRKPVVRETSPKETFYYETDNPEIIKALRESIAVEEVKEQVKKNEK